ncbi:TniB family NTP-binding protein [Roseateles chitinivorans]|uniref:TniB family NTP-binding protein n=1 Tax=Roseateles chitinivorans TaxID=2917965 RepID=UPI003D678437
MKPTEILRYYDHPNVDFKGNPLAEFMPYLDHQRMRAMLTCPINFHEVERDHSDDLRIQYVSRIKEFFHPTDQQVSFAVKVWNSLLQSLKQRNPKKASADDAFYDLCGQLESEVGYRPSPNDKISCQTYIVLLGTPGVGKTRLLMVLFGRLPRILYHPLHEVFQVPAVIISSPGKGTDSKTLPFSIYSTLYELAVAAGLPAPRVTLVSSVKAISNAAISLANMLNLGVVIIDEMQHILRGTEGADNAVMKLVTDFVNEFPAPIVAVGTWQAAQIAQLEFRLGRRSVSLESAQFRRLRPGKEFTELIVELFKYQFLLHRAEATPEIVDEFYFHTQGIHDLVVKLYIICQVTAIDNGTELITVELIRECAEKHFSLVATPIRMMREGAKENDPILYDLEPDDLNKYLDLICIEAEMRASNRSRKGLSIAKLLAKVQLARSLYEGGFATQDTAATVAEAVVNRKPKASPAEHLIAALEPTVKKSPRITASTKFNPALDAQFEEMDEDDLRRIAYKARRSGEAVAQAFRERGLLPSRVDELLDYC